MPRPVVWTLAGTVILLLAFEAALLFRPLPRTPPPPASLADSIRELERHTDRLDQAYERLESQLTRFIARAPAPTRDMAARELHDELKRLGNEIAAMQRVVNADPDRILVIPSMKLDIEKLQDRIDEAETAGDRLRAAFARRGRWLLYLMAANGVISLLILMGLARPARPGSGRRPATALENIAPAP